MTNTLNIQAFEVASIITLYTQNQNHIGKLLKQLSAELQRDSLCSKEIKIKSNDKKKKKIKKNNKQ